MMNRMDTFRGMLQCALALPYSPMNTGAHAHDPHAVPSTIWDITAELIDAGGGSCVNLPQCTEEEARALSAEFPYSAGEIMAALQPGPYTALRTMGSVAGW